MSSLVDMTHDQIAENRTRVGLTRRVKNHSKKNSHFTESISLLRMTWLRKEPGHLQQWYWVSFTELLPQWCNNICTVQLPYRHDCHKIVWEIYQQNIPTLKTEVWHGANFDDKVGTTLSVMTVLLSTENLQYSTGQSPFWPSFNFFDLI